jgi:hypothetical protein
MQCSHPRRRHACPPSYRRQPPQYLFRLRPEFVVASL